MTTTKRTFTKEFREQAVKMVLEDGLAQAEVARRLGVGHSVIFNWVQAVKTEGAEALRSKGKSGGTSPSKMFNGLRRYLAEKKVKYRRFASIGWREVPNFVSVDGRAASLNCIKEGTLGKNSVLILIGWCKYDAETDNCDIFDGHWMTVVGYGKRSQRSTGPRYSYSPRFSRTC